MKFLGLQFHFQQNNFRRVAEENYVFFCKIKRMHFNLSRQAP